MYDNLQVKSLSSIIDDIHRLVESDLQPWEKVERISGLLRRSDAGADAVAFYIVMDKAREK